MFTVSALVQLCDLCLIVTDAIFAMLLSINPFAKCQKGFCIVPVGSWSTGLDFIQ